MSNDAHTEPHVLPYSVYFGVFGALLALTAVTVGVSYADLGQLSLYVALAVALVKAGFVAGYFMHLRYDDRFHSLVFFGSLIFLAVFFVLLFTDLATRGRLVPEHAPFALRTDQQVQRERGKTVTIGGETLISGTHERVLPEDSTPKPAPAAAPAPAAPAPAAAIEHKPDYTGLPEAAIAEAKTTFTTRCVVCHGASGAGDEAAAAALNPKPRNFADPAWKKSVTDEQIEKVIVEGGPAIGKSPVMAANPDLKAKPDVIKALRAFIRGFQMPGGDAEKPADGATGDKPAEGAAADDQVPEAALAEAKTVFTTRCAACHGTAGAGDGVAAAALNPKPRNLGDPAWQKAVTDEQIEKVIVEGGPAIGKSPLMTPNPDLKAKPDVVRGLRVFIRSLAQ